MERWPFPLGGKEKGKYRLSLRRGGSVCKAGREKASVKRGGEWAIFKSISKEREETSSQGGKKKKTWKMYREKSEKKRGNRDN